MADSRSGSRDNRNQGEGQNRKKYDLIVLIPSINKDDSTVLVRAVLFDAEGGLVSGTSIVFSVDNVPQIGDYATSDKGIVEYTVKVPAGAKALSVSAYAVIEGKPSAGPITVPVNAVAKTKDPDEVEILAEEIKHDHGNFTYFISVVNAVTRRPVGADVAFMPHSAINWRAEFNNWKLECKEQGFRHTIPIDGEMITIKIEDPGKHEIDMIPVKYPANKKQLEPFGPLRVPIEAKPYSPALVKLFKGFE